MFNKSKFLPLLAAGAVAVSAVPVAMAANSSSSSKANSKVACKGPADRAKDSNQMAKDLAAKLGGDVTAAKVKTAMKATMDAQRKSDNGTRPDQLTDAQRKAKADEVVKALAGKLGVSEEKLRSALTELAKERVAKDLKSGKLTQAQADEITKAIDSGDAPVLPGPGGPHGPGPDGQGPGQPNQTQSGSTTTN